MKWFKIDFCSSFCFKLFNLINRFFSLLSKLSLFLIISIMIKNIYFKFSTQSDKKNIYVKIYKFFIDNF